MDNLEVNKMNPRKTCKLIDDLTSFKCGRIRNISEIEVDNEHITSAVEMAEAFNDFFFLQLLHQIWQMKYSRQLLSQNSLDNSRTQYFLLNLQALALYAGFWTS